MVDLWSTIRIISHSALSEHDETDAFAGLPGFEVPDKAATAFCSSFDDDRTSGVRAASSGCSDKVEVLEGKGLPCTLGFAKGRLGKGFCSASPKVFG